jgi:hypothetical protein
MRATELAKFRHVDLLAEAARLLSPDQHRNSAKMESLATLSRERLACWVADTQDKPSPQ